MNNGLYRSRPIQSLPPSGKLQGRDLLSAWWRFELIGCRCLAIIATVLIVCSSVVNAAPTPKPAATPKLTAALTATDGPMQLGQPVTNFVKTYGQPEHPTDEMGKPDEGTYIFKDTLWIDTTLPSNAANPKLLVESIDDSNTDGKGWTTINEAAKACEAYMPKDSKLQKTVNNPAETFEGEQSPPSTTRFYISPSLAALFQAKDFVDSEGKPVPSGTFSITYGNADTTSQRIENCYVGIGNND